MRFWLRWNVKFRSGPKETYKFLWYLRILRFTNDLDRFVLDLNFCKVIQSLNINVRQKCYKLLMDNVNDQCDRLLAKALSWEIKWKLIK